jgi:hypothetical protein
MNAATPLLFDEVIVFTAEIETAVIDVALQWTLCRLPVTWDQLAAGFASDMGPPPLPVMGPP